MVLISLRVPVQRLAPGVLVLVQKRSAMDKVAIAAPLGLPEWRVGVHQSPLVCVGNLG